jgi:site-specific DNA-methyltransferase (adenine-specific)/adenine-specific DNA-methyltransferase
MPLNEELRQRIIERLRRGDELPREWASDLFPPEKMEYELVYHGKERESDIIANTMAVPLQEVRTFGKNGSDWRNKLILGDNLQVLKRLIEMKREGRLHNDDGTPGVRLVYIDPPFATQQEFKGSQDQKAYQDKIVGAQFIEFLRKRIVMIRELLSSDGFLIVHLDYRYVGHIRVLMDEIFGKGNFRNEIILKRNTKSVQAQFDQISSLAVANYTLLLYSKSTNTRIQKLANTLDVTTEGKWDTYWRSSDRPTMRYEIFGVKPEKGQWRWEKKRGYQAKQNYVDFLNSGGSDDTLDQYYLSRFEETGKKLDFVRLGPRKSVQRYVPPRTEKISHNVWMDIPSSSRLTGYPTEKSEQLLDRIISWLSKPNDLVLDCFAGSGTTLAVAEKLGRKWIGVDRGKLAMYTIQKRLLTLKKEIGNRGKPLTPKSFALYNAGLYDFPTLKQLPREDWRFFALQLFECKDEPHIIGGMRLDGKRRGSSVLVYDHHSNPDQKIDEETVMSLHRHIGDKVGPRFYIIAPRHTFAFQQDYLAFDDVHYYALRIPYSFINELHRREFRALQQPSDENAVNDLIDAEGFDFIQPPIVKYKLGTKKRPGQMLKEAFIKLEAFDSKARVRGTLQSRGLEAFSILLLDLNYNGEVFQLHSRLYATDLEAAELYAWFPIEAIGEKIMAVFMDIYGNEASFVITRADLKLPAHKE